MGVNWCDFTINLSHSLKRFSRVAAAAVTLLSTLSALSADFYLCAAAGLANENAGFFAVANETELLLL